MTGIFDNAELTLDYSVLNKLKNTAVEVNKTWAEQLGINQSAATTCVKPSGTVSELVDSASGMHPRWSQYYIRTVRADNKDPLTQFMKDQGIPNEPAFGKEESTTVFSFPKKSPTESMTTDKLSAHGHFHSYLTLQRNYCEHKPSVTINVAEDEWVKMAHVVYDNFYEMVGVSFLPAVDHVYKQAPFQTCTEEEYLASVAKMPKKIDWTQLKEYEKGVDTTTSSQELACTGNVCAVVDIT